ncbi:MAG: hypothetical protein LIR50_14025 [Bacillota bacterium]|nr:hypothetical protein [Bacillota bacterium]
MKKRNTFLIVSLFLCALIIAGATYAYLTATSNEKTNIFTKGNNISIELREPAWDGEGFDTDMLPEETSDMGKAKADSILPGRVIPKDPTVKNTSDDSVWIAIKLEYTGEISSYDDFKSFASFEDKSDKWIAADLTNTVFYYKTQVGHDEITDSLFKNVTISKNANYDQLKNYKIVVTAYAVQAEGIDSIEDAKVQLNDLIKSSSAAVSVQ